MTRPTNAIIATRLRRLVLVIMLLLLSLLAISQGEWGAQLWDYQEDIVYLGMQHIELTLISGGLAIAIGIPLGIILTRQRLRSVAEGVMQLLNIGTTIPTLAVLALSMTFLGIGTLPALFALWLASLLYIVRNTYSGIISLPSALLEAAQGMGLTATQVLFKVELPNALLVIFAGVRTALTINVGTVPLAFLIGAGGLGELIFTGIDLNDTTMMLAGAIPTALLAIFVDIVIAGIAATVIPRGIKPLAEQH